MAKVIGLGNTGSKLAQKFSKDAFLFSTAEEDSANFKDATNHYVLSKEGARKNFKIGSAIWDNKTDRLREILSVFKEEDIVIFSSMGGGSGSSGIAHFARMLIENNNNVMVVGIIPTKLENNPPLANAVNSINSLIPLLDGISVMLFDNEKLLKRFSNDWSEVNDHIVSKVYLVVNLLTKFNDKEKFSPLTLDSSELKSTIFSGNGFVDLSESFLEETTPEFEYGKLDKTTKNCLIAMFVDSKLSDKKVEKLHGVFTGTLNKYSRKIPNARLITGILRGDFNFTNSVEKVSNRCYITIASGLNITPYMKKIEKLRDDAVKKATGFLEKKTAKKILSKKETNILDI